MTRRISLTLSDAAAAVLDAVPDETSRRPIGRGGGKRSGKGAFVSRLLEEHGERMLLPGPEYRPPPPGIDRLVKAYPGERTGQVLARWHALTGETGRQGKTALLRAEQAGKVRRTGDRRGTRWWPPDYPEATDAG